MIQLQDFETQKCDNTGAANGGRTGKHECLNSCVDCTDMTQTFYRHDFTILLPITQTCFRSLILQISIRIDLSFRVPRWRKKSKIPGVIQKTQGTFFVNLYTTAVKQLKSYEPISLWQIWESSVQKFFERSCLRITTLHQKYSGFFINTFFSTPDNTLKL